MHELSVARDLLDLLAEHVGAPAAPRVTTVRVRLGSLAGIVPESLAFCFDTLAADTPFRRARLAIDRVPAVCRCRDCDSGFEPADLVFVCPRCGSFQVELASGLELELAAVELDDHPEPAPCP
jgi:hydrogenase nickel incorporation protein HypA/HybF